MITVTYSGNHGIFDGILLSALSVLLGTSEPVRFLILTMDLTDRDPAYAPIDENQMRVLQRVLSERGDGSLAERTDVTDLYRAELAQGRNRRSSYTPFAQIRLFLDVLPTVPDKLVYLDADTLLAGDIKELYEIDLGDCEYGAVLDHMGKFWINRHYVNSGVLLLNMRRIRETGLFAGARKMVRTRLMKMPDQTALNKLVLKKYFLPRRFNEQRDLKPDTVVKHFCKGIKYFPFFHIYNYKPWQRQAVRQKLHITAFDDLYAEFDRVEAAYGTNVSEPLAECAATRCPAR